MTAAREMRAILNGDLSKARITTFVTYGDKKKRELTDKEAKKAVLDSMSFVKSPIRGANIRIVRIPNVQAIRSDLGLSQTAFAKKFQIPVATIRDWEQGRRQPDQAARNFLRVVAMNPKAVMKALG